MSSLLGGEASRLIVEACIPRTRSLLIGAAATSAPGHPARLRRLYADLLAARRDFGRRSARLHPDEEADPVLVVVRGDSIRIVADLGDCAQPLPPDATLGGRMLFDSESSRYGGGQRAGAPPAELAPSEVVVFGPPSWRSF